MNRYLIIEKEQRVETKDKYPYAVMRLIEEIEKQGDEYQVTYYKDIEIIMDSKEYSIFVNGKDIRDFTHILFRGHSLGTPLEYETKRIISNYIEQHNLNNTDKRIAIQNTKVMKNIPYYDKIYITTFCIQNNIPIATTYYRANKEELVKQNIISYPLIAKHYAGVNDLRMIDGKEKIKKNVYKLDYSEEFSQEYLCDKDLNEYILQEFLPSGEDMRIFVSKGVAVAGFLRKATEGFMTVKSGEYTYIDFSLHPEIKAFAENAAQKFEADFIAIDLMRKNNDLVLIEVSLNPGFKAFETKTEGDNQVNIAKTIIESF